MTQSLVNKFIVKPYQRTNLKPYKDLLPLTVHPIYIRIQYENETYNIKSKLWYSFYKSKNLYYGIKFPEVGIDISLHWNTLLQDLQFSIISQCEVIWIERIKDSLLAKSSFSIKNVKSSYDYYCEDALETIAKGVLNKLIESELFSINFSSFYFDIVSSKNNHKSAMLFLIECGLINVLEEKFKLGSNSNEINHLINDAFVFTQWILHCIPQANAFSNEIVDPIAYSKYVNKVWMGELVNTDGINLLHTPVIKFFDSDGPVKGDKKLNERVVKYLTKYLPEKPANVIPIH